MTKKKKRKNEILESFGPGLGLAGVSLGSSILGGSMQSHLPAGMTNPLATTGRVTGTFVGPMVTLGAFGFVTKQLRKTKKKMKGGKK